MVSHSDNNDNNDNQRPLLTNNDQIIETKNLSHDSGNFKHRRVSARFGLGKS